MNLDAAIENTGVHMSSYHVIFLDFLILSIIIAIFSSD